ncbi:MAG: transposase [Gammaproteobacteria bacterium]|nr:transposase [Gammaproteobacteria bacterium]
MSARTMYRGVIYRLYPRSQRKHDMLSRLAGAYRFVWNEAIAHNQQQLEIARLLAQFPATADAVPAPSTTFFSMGKWFTSLRSGKTRSSRGGQETWLQELPFAIVRYSLKRQSGAWKKAFKGGGFPKYKSRLGNDSFTIPEKFRLSRKGGDPYLDRTGCKPVQVTVKRFLGKWYAVVTYAVPDVREDNGRSIGMDMDVGQVATREGAIYFMPDTSRLEARKRRYQRMMARRQKGSSRRARARHSCAKTQRGIAAVRADWQHRVSRGVTDIAGTVVVEALNVRGMTASARGTRDQPGKNVSAKAGLNREVLQTGWTSFRMQLEYKASRVVSVDPAYTSRTCHACGSVDKGNRKMRSEFECVHCGHQGNADVNAALSILASGIGASGRGEALGLSTSTIRQNVSDRLAA